MKDARRAALRLGGLAAVSGVWLGGCSAYKSPKFDVTAIQESARSDEALVLTFVLNASNPNDTDLPLRQARYRCSIDGVEVFSGRRSAEAVVQRFGTQSIELPVVVRADRFDLARLDQPGEVRYELEGSVEYQTPGELAEVLFDSGVRRPKAGLDAAGVITLGQ